MKLTTAEQAAREAHFQKHPTCWMCIFLGAKPVYATELHHIAGRGRCHEVRENYAALCARHHQAIQSRADAELVCLALKRLYDGDHNSPTTICSLRQRAETCWTHNDVELCHRIMLIMRECCR